MKRWGFSGQPASHGQSLAHRIMGSAGGSQGSGSRVLPGKRMAGRMGGERVTVQNLKVLKVDAENGIVVVNGALLCVLGLDLDPRERCKLIGLVQVLLLDPRAASFRFRTPLRSRGRMSHSSLLPRPRNQLLQLRRHDWILKRTKNQNGEAIGEVPV